MGAEKTREIKKKSDGESGISDGPHGYLEM